MAQPTPWPEQYSGKTLPFIVGHISISVPTNITKVLSTEEGLIIFFDNHCTLGMERIDGNFYTTRQIPEGITEENDITVSSAGKIPFTHTAIPAQMQADSIDYPIWKFGIALRSIIYAGDNIVNSMQSDSLEIYSYYSPSAKTPYVAQVHSSAENEYVLVTGSGFTITTFREILGTITASK